MQALAIQQHSPIASNEWSARAAGLLQQFADLDTVTDNDTYQTAGSLLQAITSHSNQLDKDRLEACRPINAKLKEIKAETDKARKPLEDVKKAISKSMADYTSEQSRIADEEARRIREQQAEEARLAKELLGEDTPEPEPEPQIPTAAPPKSSAVRTVKRLAFELTDLTQVPHRFLVVDSAKVNAFLRENRDAIIKTLEEDDDAFVIPGLSLTIETSIQSR